MENCRCLLKFVILTYILVLCDISYYSRIYNHKLFYKLIKMLWKTAVLRFNIFMQYTTIILTYMSNAITFILLFPLIYNKVFFCNFNKLTKKILNNNCLIKISYPIKLQ